MRTRAQNKLENAQGRLDLLKTIRDLNDLLPDDRAFNRLLEMRLTMPKSLANKIFSETSKDFLATEIKKLEENIPELTKAANLAARRKLGII